MDYEGQAAAELLMYRMIVFFAAAGFMAGWSSGSFMLMVHTYAAGLVLTLAAVVPNWPWFNRKPLDWLPPLKPDEGKGSGGGGGDGDGGEAGEREAGSTLSRIWHSVCAWL